MILELTVPGDPKPQGSKKGFMSKQGKYSIVEVGGRPLKIWREMITIYAITAMRKIGWEQQTQGPIGVELVFGMKKPARPKYDTPAVRPDIDKLARAVLDALTDAEVYADDSQVISLTCTKTYTTPGVNVKAWKIQ
jgi:Holliday junction resolvase RusA-like endonuclease